MWTRRNFLIASSVTGMAAGGPQLSLAQSDYPQKLVSIIVPFSPGGRTDVVARLTAQHLQPYLGRPIAIVNKPGAGSVAGSKEVAHAKPDGYTLGFFSSAALTAQYTVPTPISLADYELIAIVNTDPAAVAVRESAPWRSLRDFVVDARKQPNHYRIGMIPGASAQIFAAGLARGGDIQLLDVPFKGDTEGAVALAGGHIEVHVAVPVSYKSLIEANKVRILAAAMEQSSPLYGNLPTFRENGIDLVIGTFHGIFAPRGTQRDIIGKIADAVERVASTPEFQNAMGEVGARVDFRKGEAAAEYLSSQDETYRKIVDELGLRVVTAR